MIPTLIAYILTAIVLTKPDDSVTTPQPVAWKPDDLGGAIVVEWTPKRDNSNTDGFRHFVRSGAVTCRTFYDHNLKDVKIGISLQRGEYAMAATDKFRPAGWSTVAFTPGKRYALVWCWIKRGPEVEMMAFLNGRLVSWDLDIGKPLRLWPSTARVGARDLRPGWPERHTCTGTIHGVRFIALRASGKLQAL